jgi:membrane protein DedA with SNARE-associated domain
MTKKILKAILLPLILLVSLLIFFALYKFLHLPSSEELIVIVRHAFEKYGYPVLFLSAFIEAVPPINIYYPGSSVILLAAAFSRQGSLNFFAVVVITTIATLIAYTIDFLIGYHGYFKVLKRFGFAGAIGSAKEKIEKNDRWAWLLYFHPNFGAVTATAIGTVKMPFRKFIANASIATLLWVIFWAGLCYLSSEKIASLIAARWFVIFIVLIWIAAKALQAIKAQKKQ